MRPVLDRLMERSFLDANGCRVWIGAKIPRGYGSIATPDGQKLTHRVAYELAVGPIPDGLVIDHLCRNRLCINVEHMEVVTRGENVLRGEGISAANAVKTHCKRGHEFTPENTYQTRNPSGPGRECLTCKRELARRKRKVPAAVI